MHLAGRRQCKPAALSGIARCVRGGCPADWSHQRVGSLAAEQRSRLPEGPRQRPQLCTSRTLPDRLRVDRGPFAIRLDGSDGRAPATPLAELLVVGSRGLGGFGGLVMGSTSRGLIEHAPCPVMVVGPAPEAA
ncbi:universal stress protein [Actinoplanes sp. DH11]|uniref:universal stress protein n=1 Tax=Actinoplanes sp. DH11 TaxID=2857011 RepID=UPI0035B26C2E